MPSKSRGGLSKREYSKKMGTILKPTGKSAGKSTGSKVMDTKSAKKAASSSVSKESNALAEAQKEYLASLAPSTEETAATTAHRNLLMGQEQETKKIGSQAIASPFIERQTERLASDVSEKVIPLKYQIAALQSQREAQGEIARAKVNYAKDTYNRKVASMKASNPLDDEYKTLRNQKLKNSINKPKAPKYNLESDIDNIISSGKGWHDTAQILKKKNIPINRGSKADILLNKRFAPPKSKKNSNNPYS